MKTYDKLQACLKSVREITDFVPEIALVLGSGVGDYATQIEIVKTIEYSDIEGFPVSTVIGHAGRFVCGYINEIPVIIMQGRVHYYEGYTMQDVVLPTRLMGLMGAKVLFLTNASGGINYNFKAGDLMLIRDHISSLVPSPLLGQNIDEIGSRFTDMSKIYDKEIADIIMHTAIDNGIILKEGIYIQTTGPQYESPAEIKMCRGFGADAVGMSTACEAIAARHMGLRVCGVSCISNLAAGMSRAELSHQEVTETANRVGEVFANLVTQSVINIKKVL